MSSSVRKASPAPEKQRKRPRAALACEQCRARKYRCDEQYPCKTCKKHNWDCVYKGGENFRRNQHAPSYVAELEREVRDLRARLGLDPDKASLALGPHPSARSSVATQGTLVPPPTISVATEDRSAAADAEELESGSEPASLVESNSEVRGVNEYTNAVEFHGNTSSLAFLALARRQHAPPDEDGAQGTGASFDLPIHRASLVSTLQNLAFSPKTTQRDDSRSRTNSVGKRCRKQQKRRTADDSNASSDSDAADNHGPEEDYEDDDDTAERGSEDGRGYYFSQAQGFIDGFFENLHLLHPILNKGEFVARCEDLWFGRPATKSFVALYYAVLALGVSTRAFSDAEPMLDGLTRRQWVHRFFELSQAALGQVRSAPNDLDSVQGLVLLAKVCQNGLNSHMAYMFLGVAVRAALAAGYHREPRPLPESDEYTPDTTKAAAIARTWWALYSFETEVAFSLGRPDGLGADEHHNRAVPPVVDGETDVIALMVPFARITRKVALLMCASHPRTTLRDRLARAAAIAAETDAWWAALPNKMRPTPEGKFGAVGVPDVPIWARRQRLVLHHRYYNIRMVLFRPFLLHALAQGRHRPPPPPLLDVVYACIEAAQRTIDAIHAVFSNHRFFRNWFYNTTYVLYAGAIMLSCAARFRNRPGSPRPEHTALEPLRQRRAEFVRYVEMTIEVLGVMHESSVAREAASLLRQSLAATEDGAPPRWSEPARNLPAAPALPSQPCLAPVHPPQPFAPSSGPGPPHDAPLAAFPSVPLQQPWPMSMPQPQQIGQVPLGLAAHPLSGQSPPGSGPAVAGLDVMHGPKQEFGLPRMGSDGSFSEVLDEPMPFLPMEHMFGANEPYAGLLFDDAGGFGGAVTDAGGWPDFGAYGAGGQM